MRTETLSKPARKELVVTIRERYSKASKGEKARILNEFTQVSGYHRKHAIRLLRNSMINEPQPVFVISRKVYDEAVKDALIVLWETADRICGKRLKAVIPNLVAAMERHGHLKLEPSIREKVLSVSASMIDRILGEVRKNTVHRKKKRIFKKLSKEIATKTSHDWKDSLPGYVGDK